MVGALVKAAKTQGIKVKIRAVKYKSGQLSATLLHSFSRALWRPLKHRVLK
jgi:hypothetical protein